MARGLKPLDEVSSILLSPFENRPPDLNRRVSEKS
jgi:hypothetical protein